MKFITPFSSGFEKPFTAARSRPAQPSVYGRSAERIAGIVAAGGTEQPAGQRDRAMDFAPTAEQRAWEERARRVAQEALGPRAAAMDARGTFPHENFADLRREGFLRLAVPAWHGGLWVDHV